MSSPEPRGPPGAPLFSVGSATERSRTKDRVEAGLAALKQLELLRQTQETRVLSALYLGDSPFTRRPQWTDPRSAGCATDAPGGSVSEGPHPRTNSLQCSHTDLRTSLEQQLAELTVDSEVKSADSDELEGNQLSSGDVHAVKQNGSPKSNHQPVMSRPLLTDERSVQTKTIERLMSDPSRPVIVTEVLGKMRDAEPGPEDFQQSPKVETYIFGLIQRQALPTRPSKPRTSPVHDARAVSMVRQSSFCCKDEQFSSKKISLQEVSTPSQISEGTTLQAYQKLDQEIDLRVEYGEDAQFPYHQLQQSVQHQLGLYHKSKQSASLDYASWRILQTHRNSNTSDPESPQHFHNYPSTIALAKSYQPSSPEEQLVSAEYIPAHPCRSSNRAYAHHVSTSHKGSEVSKTNQNTLSQERGLHQDPAASQVQPCRSSGGPKKNRPNEDRGGATKKVVKKVSRSQLQSGPQRGPERKYTTVERDGGGSGSSGRGSRSTQSRNKKQQQGSSRRWQSTLELSQDEADQPSAPGTKQSSLLSNQRNHFLRRARKCRPPHPTYAYHHHSHLHQHMGVHLERDHVCQVNEDYPPPGLGESESTLSEADSPDSSSLSSDSDESGGLIWPQPVSPQKSFPRPSASPRPPASPRTPQQSKAFVKIKASHALKKKILRFRTGSLKVMTTV